ncbi:inactive pancreatic lipase-related protein 1-like [Armigeres subalbatus]|uniref:inactive pancreatic lipase-related protein 1-like n=1 Tax=Armigeres subalbatus TaxID=124917 RepID=UPI002ED42212
MNKMRHRVVVAILAFLATGSGFCDAERQTREASEDIFFIENDCNTTEKFAMVIHGWKESCSTEWVIDTISNLTLHRGGCIICMDYSKYSIDDYFNGLVPKFPLVVEAILGKLEELEVRGFDPANGYLFGFSFGAQSSIEAGRRFGFRRIGRIDVCDPAGPGFDGDRVFSSLDPKCAAKNVQCIHTSNDKGTFVRECSQNWNMGNCGTNQPAAGQYPKGSHGLCPYFYNSAFVNEFRAVDKPKECFSFRAVAPIPEGFRMGYFSEMDRGLIGDYFSRTTSAYPYNELPDND